MFDARVKRDKWCAKSLYNSVDVKKVFDRYNDESSPMKPQTLDPLEPDDFYLQRLISCQRRA